MADGPSLPLARRRLLIAAKEAGAGSVLAALAREWEPATGSVAIVSTVASQYFTTLALPVTVHDAVPSVEEATAWIRAHHPEIVVVGASAGLTLEKRLIVAATACGVPVVSVVDHFWNLWQRFAHDERATRWHYLPDEIHVPSESCKLRIVAQGAPPERVRVFRHPLMTRAAAPRHASTADAELRVTLGIPRSATTVLFASEFNFAEDPLWHWEQSYEPDIALLITTLLDTARDAEQSIVVLVKLHPAQPDDWSTVLARYPQAIHRVIGAVDKGALFAASDAVFGLRSMLVVEGALAGVPAYAFQTVRPDDAARMSEIRDDITELSSTTAVREAVTAVAARNASRTTPSA